MRLSEIFSRPEVWQDWQLLSRIFYRNWNQHRNSVYYRRLYELRRVMRILDQLYIREMFEDIIGAFFTKGMSRNSRKAKLWQMLPCQYYMAAVAGRIAQIVQLVKKIHNVCWNVYVQFTAQTAQSLFMPLSMVVQGLAARLYLVMDVWFKDLCSIYNLLWRWLPSLPACPDSLNGKKIDGLVPPDSLNLSGPLETPGILERLTADARKLSLQQMSNKRNIHDQEFKPSKLAKIEDTGDEDIGGKFHFISREWFKNLC
ncbi:hypothetical protein IWW36_003638 [Coemansia brasiliensis]|uniref:Nucleolus and neural progenitor protein-like N-terminal domain-containing protein n=1 Tax=Coemansia brasiliensis TaxID=2650707 RepID=A0A9W8LZK0_9FUNG|nr:hypothetical protein IWW36_003638 [Coemansia brasiliensis]